VFEQRQRAEFRPLRWFLIAGAIGIVVAVVLTELMAHDLVSTAVAFMLWPSAIAGIVDPGTLADKVLVATCTFGGEFALYGLAGLLLGSGVNAVRNFISSR
jgi:hypothetical protein